MKRALTVFSIAIVMMVSTLAVATDAPPAPTETAIAAAPSVAPVAVTPPADAPLDIRPRRDVTIPDDPTPADIADAVVQTIGAWQTVGWLAGVVGIAYLLVLLSKFKPIDNLLKKYNLKWIRPLAAMVFGALAGASTALAAGQKIPQVVIAGVLAGFGSTGFHEVMAVLTSAKDRERRSS